MSIRDQLRFRTPPPVGHYVYAYINAITNEPVYVGQAHGDMGHLRRLGAFCSQRERNPIVCILKTGLTETEATTSERDLNRLLAL